MDLNLKGKNAFVCGSTQGIGKAIAEELAALGANITLCARNEKSLESVKADLSSAEGQSHQVLVADFSKADSLNQLVSDHLGQGNQYQILINNTGGPPGGQAIDAGIDEFRIAFNQHLICNQILAQSMAPGMKAAGFGRIVNVISTSVKIPLNGLGVSNTIRGAVANWSKTLANELGQFGITVNNVLPGATATQRLSSIIENKANKTGKRIDEVEQAMRSSVPANRFAEANEVAAAAAFLCTPAASYINGVNLPVDGGRTGSL